MCGEYEDNQDKHKPKVREEENNYITKVLVHSPTGGCTNIKPVKKGIREKGAITVEASMLLPLVIVVCFSLMLFFQLLMIQTRLQSALEEVASEMAMAGYVEELIPDRELEGDGIVQGLLKNAVFDVAEMGIGTAYVQLRIPQKLDEAWLDKTMIDTISYILSPVALEAGLIDLRAYYSFHFPGLSMLDIDFCQRAVRKKWSGLANLEFNGNSETGEAVPEKPTEKKVYVTKEGKVYHLFRDCRVLKRDIKTEKLSDMPDKRNNGGGKYYACEACIRGGANLVVYYTAEGDRYHNSISCGSLIRYISQVGIGEVKGKPACKFCLSRSVAGDEDVLEGL